MAHRLSEHEPSIMPSHRDMVETEGKSPGIGERTVGTWRARQDSCPLAGRGAARGAPED
jgi:hypothetical protein